jgi:POT family proton-dependent oligopeptide transporter
MPSPSTPPSDFTPPPGESTILGHPKGLFLLFLVEMWERFSYYGMRGLLVLYLISVIAVHQLKPGTYTNTLEIQEAGGPEAAASVIHSRDFHVVVAGDGATAMAPDTTANAPIGTGGLVIQRLQLVSPATDDNPAVWDVDATDNGGDVVVTGPAGTPPADDPNHGFTNTETRYRVSNPTSAPIKVNIALKRASDADQTYFRVNNSTGTVSAEIKPDSQLKAGENPYEVAVVANTHDSGRNWLRSDASVLYGWYTGLAYLFPILGGIIADKLIGTHRSMLVGGLLITLGHIILGISGFGEFAMNKTGLSIFVMGLAVIVLGTGHFKPTVSVMVGQLYKQGDPRRDGAFTIFYMGINLGAFICAFVCGSLGEWYGWHYGFAAAAVGMMLGLGLYMIGKPMFLRGIGDPPPEKAAKATGTSMLFLVGALILSAIFAAGYHFGAVSGIQKAVAYLQENAALGWTVVALGLIGILGWVGWFVRSNRPEDRGPVLTIFVFMFFNAFFWLAFEQAGSSINIFTEQNTDRTIGSFEVPATWFQSVNAGLIFILAPIFAATWTRLGAKGRNPSQPVKIALGLIFLGLGYIFMVWAGKIAFGGGAKASMFLIITCYFWHTVGELCLSPTGLSYVTKAAPVRFVSLLMGIWFVSYFIANLGGGLIASYVEAIESGKLKLPWSFGGQADYFFLFVVSSIGAGVVVLVLTPFLKKLMRNPND